MHRLIACALGFVNLVVPRDQLAQETTGLASRIAESDRFMLRMIKLSVNQAQDAMGFSSSIRANHSNFMLQAARMRREDEGKPVRRLKPVDQALKRLGKS